MQNKYNNLRSKTGHQGLCSIDILTISGGNIADPSVKNKEASTVCKNETI